MCIFLYLQISRSLSSVLDRSCFSIIQEKFVIFLYLVYFFHHIVCFSLGLIWRITSSNIPTYYLTNAREFGHVIYANFKAGSRLFWRNQLAISFWNSEIFICGRSFSSPCLLLCSKLLNCSDELIIVTAVMIQSCPIIHLPSLLSLKPFLITVPAHFTLSSCQQEHIHGFFEVMPVLNSLFELLVTLLKVGGINMPAFVFHSFLCVPIESFPCLCNGKKTL